MPTICSFSPRPTPRSSRRGLARAGGGTRELAATPRELRPPRHAAVLVDGDGAEALLRLDASLARTVVTDLRRLLIEAERLVRANADAVRALAAARVERRTLSGSEVADSCAAHPSGGCRREGEADPGINSADDVDGAAVAT